MRVAGEQMTGGDEVIVIIVTKGSIGKKFHI